VLTGIHTPESSDSREETGRWDRGYDDRCYDDVSAGSDNYMWIHQKKITNSPDVTREQMSVLTGLGKV